MMERIHEAELPLIHSIQSIGLPRWMMDPLSWFGVEVIVALGVLFYLGVDRKIGLRLLAMYFASDLINIFLKVAFHQPRPYWADSSVKNFSSRGAHVSYGFPSGHVQNAAATYGSLAIVLKKPWIWALLFFLIVLTAFSRIQLGVHFPTDTLGGLIVGLLTAVLWLRAENSLQPKLSIMSDARKLMLVAVILALTFTICWICFRFTVPTDSAPWAEKAKRAREVARLGTPIGALFGLAWGGLRGCQLHFDPGGPIRLRLARIVIGGGIVGVIIKITHLWRFDGVAEFAWRFLLTCGLTLWVTWGAPALFLRFRLANRLA